jgi:hypothetical protein
MLKFKIGKHAEKGDTVVALRSGDTITKGKSYKVIKDDKKAWHGQSVGVSGDNGKFAWLNTYWWDFI